MSEVKRQRQVLDEVEVDERLAAELRSARGTPQLPDADALFARVHAEIEQDDRGLRALRSLPTAVRRGLLGALVLALCALVFGLALRADFGVYPLPRMLLTLGGLGLLLALCGTVALRPLQRAPLPRWARPALLLGCVGGTAALYLLPAAHAAHPASTHDSGLLPLLRHAGACMLVGLALAAPVYFLLRRLDRGPTAQRWLMAASAGLTSNLLLQLKCPITSPAHLLLGHLAALLLLLGLEAWLQARAVARVPEGG